MSPNVDEHVHVLVSDSITMTARELAETTLDDGREAKPVSLAASLDDQIEEVRSAFEGATVEREGEAGLDSEGTGIGTYLVESLVAGYGGEAWIEDDDPGGTVFVVELPKADAAGPNPTPF